MGALLMLGIGKLSTLTLTHDNPYPPDPNKKYPFYVAAGVLGASTIYGLVASFVCDGRATELEDAASREAAYELHMRAKDAARAGDCTVAREVDAQIREHDAEYYRDVFRLDAAIQSCLQPSPGP